MLVLPLSLRVVCRHSPAGTTSVTSSLVFGDLQPARSQTPRIDGPHVAENVWCHGQHATIHTVYGRDVSLVAVNTGAIYTIADEVVIELAHSRGQPRKYLDRG